MPQVDTKHYTLTNISIARYLLSSILCLPIISCSFELKSTCKHTMTWIKGLTQRHNMYLFHPNYVDLWSLSPPLLTVPTNLDPLPRTFSFSHWSCPVTAMCRRERDGRGVRWLPPGGKCSPCSNSCVGKRAWRWVLVDPRNHRRQSQVSKCWWRGCLKAGTAWPPQIFQPP